MPKDLYSIVIDFVREKYKVNNRIPSVRRIVSEFKDQGLNLSYFYELFPEGIGEVCKKAGLHIPKERIAQTAKASNKIKHKTKSVFSTESFENRILLTEEQTRRIYGVCQLEKGAKPNTIINNLLDLDSTVRSEYHTSLGEIIAIIPFLKEAYSRKWKDRMLIEIFTTLWNNGIMKLKLETLQDLSKLISNIDKHYWGSVENFIEYVTEHSSTIYNYKLFLNGKITLNEFLQGQGLSSN